MMMKNEKIAIILLILSLVEGFVYGDAEDSNLVKSKFVDAKMDLEASATGAKLFDLSSLLLRPTYGGYPGSGGSGYYPSGYRPNYGGYNPSTYPLYPNQGYPGVSGGGYYPQSIGTNILGGGQGGSGGYGGYGGYNSGYGGYGGYGGNGGFHSYTGYLDNGYNGHRNLGYGYYRGTDRFGFYRPAEPSLQVSGYRGYD